MAVPGDSVLSITPQALDALLGFRDAEPESGGRCLYVRIVGAGAGEYKYALSIEPLTLAGPGDRHQLIGDLDVVIAQGSADRLSGAVIDWRSEPGRTGFVVQSPHRPSLDDALTSRVREVLEREVNPSIALHGGRADLVAVEGRTAYLRLSGGCQGCGQAAATLAQGIEVTLTEAVPEIADVCDVTDHASGTNPYYAPV